MSAAQKATPVPTLRPYQQQLADEVRQAYRDGYKCPLVVASTGAGKTMLFSYITHGAASRNNPVLVVAHRRELIAQISLSLARFGVEHQLVAAESAVREIKVAHYRAFGRSFVSHNSPTMVGSVQTIVRRYETVDGTLKRIADSTGKPARFLIIMDEAHHVVADTQWGDVMSRYPDALGLKVTATPQRLDGKGLGKGVGGFADTIILAPTMAWLIEQGFLSPYRAFTTSNPVDLAGIRTRMGDFAKDELAERVDRPSIIGDAVEHYKKVANGVRAVAYCVSIAHSQHTASAFTAAGIPAAHLDGDTEPAERSRVIRDFADGKYLVLCNQALFTEGFDLASVAQKDVTIDCVIDLAPTQSLGLYMQKVGRALRPAPGKVAIILDHAGNMMRHGLPDADREWTLEGKKKSSRKADNDNEPDVMVRTCKECFAMFSPVDAIKAGRAKAERTGAEFTNACCPACETDIHTQARKIEEKDGQLVELSKADMEAMRQAQRKEELRKQGQAQTVDDLVALGRPRKQAERIVQAREEKAALQMACKDALRDWHQRYRQPVKNVFGVFSGDVDYMKPKALKELLARIKADNTERRIAAGEPVEEPPAFVIEPAA